MNARAYRLDTEAMLTDSHAADRRDRRREIDRYDRADWVRIGGEWVEADYMPHPSDVADLGDNS